MLRLPHLLVTLTLFAAGATFAGDAEDIQQLLKARQFPQALERADRALASNPKDLQLRFMRAIALTETGRIEDAIKAFTQIAEENPGLPEPYNNLAVLYAQQNQLDKARAALQMAIQTNPSYAIAHENLGDLYARLASQSYDKALQLESGNAKVQTKLTLVHELFSRNPQMAPRGSANMAAVKPSITIITQKPTLPPATRAPQATPTPAPKASATPTARPAPTLAAKPSEVPKKADGAAERQRVLASLDRWANAWSKQNADGYLASYSKSFRTPGGQKYAEWAKERRERVTAPKYIEVALSDQDVEFIDDKTAKVTVRQSYKSDRLSSTTRKTFILERSGDGWLIREERAG
ncbi:nuclear transport factor 2 family protein [Chitinilyticum litopenaei]|uniref:nuclear transport factor 2 family protein n=1 Tax=Chitinilyticum litopenaei TaxID=1121276 RepID=UPI0004225079|nr:nuclear transport factor 2 family protein [Chitinilyticum litopenaei]